MPIYEKAAAQGGKAAVVPVELHPLGEEILVVESHVAHAQAAYDKRAGYQCGADDDVLRPAEHT